MAAIKNGSCFRSLFQAITAKPFKGFWFQWELNLLLARVKGGRRLQLMLAVYATLLTVLCIESKVLDNCVVLLYNSKCIGSSGSAVHWKQFGKLTETENSTNLLN